jgi:hypothetical protein
VVRLMCLSQVLLNLKRPEWVRREIPGSEDSHNLLPHPHGRLKLNESPWFWISTRIMVGRDFAFQSVTRARKA